MEVIMYIGNKRLQTFSIDIEDQRCLFTKKKWRIRKRKSTYYVERGGIKKDGERRTVFLHQLIVGAKLVEIVDHKDGNGLNNTRNNLRIVTPQQNSWNKGIHPKNKSGFKGVHPCQQTKLWRVCIFKDGKQIQGGYFDDKIAAAKKYNELAVKHFGEYARLNVIPE